MIIPSLSFERKLHKKGYNVVAGSDEVGRGCFAGPLVTACVVFDPATRVPNNVVIRDSKTMTAKQKNVAAGWIKEHAVSWGVGEVSVRKINSQGIVKATLSGFRRSVKTVQVKMDRRIDFLLVDAFYVPRTRNIPVTHQKAIKKADSFVFSVSAASIIAKVYRDALMEKLGHMREYAVYKWYKNKGYGTKEHQEAILTYGKTIHHREQFVETFLKNLSI